MSGRRRKRGGGAGGVGDVDDDSYSGDGASDTGARTRRRMDGIDALVAAAASQAGRASLYPSARPHHLILDVPTRIGATRARDGAAARAGAAVSAGPPPPSAEERTALGIRSVAAAERMHSVALRAAHTIREFTAWLDNFADLTRARYEEAAQDFADASAAAAAAAGLAAPPADDDDSVGLQGAGAGAGASSTSLVPTQTPHLAVAGAAATATFEAILARKSLAATVEAARALHQRTAYAEVVASRSLRFARRAAATLPPLPVRLGDIFVRAGNALTSMLGAYDRMQLRCVSRAMRDAMAEAIGGPPTCAHPGCKATTFVACCTCPSETAARADGDGGGDGVLAVAPSGRCGAAVCAAHVLVCGTTRALGASIVGTRDLGHRRRDRDEGCGRLVCPGCVPTCARGCPGVAPPGGILRRRPACASCVASKKRSGGLQFQCSAVGCTNPGALCEPCRQRCRRCRRTLCTTCATANGQRCMRDECGGRPRARIAAHEIDVIEADLEFDMRPLLPLDVDFPFEPAGWAWDLGDDDRGVA